ncbi:MAG: hypothetical protein A2X86_02965 [Bdellovibrionales bacterium GWA2_49_15]|nr:MAG: hypothetical protein A2X86_02965 [Bdellovibrionales bacterium GWA2_49_15]HAZ14099.1 hypothetical protein [Bdellovibrionales bacterium]
MGKAWAKFILSLLLTMAGPISPLAKAQSPDPVATAISAPMRSPQDMFFSCARCHSIGKGKLIGPDLSDVQARHEEAWLIEFIQSSTSMIERGDKVALELFLANKKLPMPDHDFTREETQALLRYIAAESKKLKANPKFLDNDFSLAPHSTNWLAILAISLLLLALVDLFFTKFLKYRGLHFLVILLSLALIGRILNEEAVTLGNSLGYEPDQPIKFSHKLHAGENKISCAYCHTSVYESKHASIPPATLCLNCHNLIRTGANTGEAEIEKIHEAVESGKSVKWVRVYNLPDHVFFSHAQHVQVGKVKCDKCHGDLTQMGRVQQVTDLSMGWCVNCHRDTKVDFDNKYYTSYKQHEALKSGGLAQVTVNDIGGNNCQKCHY